MAINAAYVAVGGVAALLALGSAAVILSDRPGNDLGGGGQSEIRGQTPNPANDTMKPVGSAEADRRAGVNRRQADEHGTAGRPYVAPPVIAQATGPQRGELPEEALPKPAEQTRAEAASPAPPPEPVIVYRDVYRDVPTEPRADAEQTAAITEQIRALLKPTPGGFVVRAYAKGDRPQPRPVTAMAAPVTGPFGTGIRHATVARAGDVAYAVLDRGFNSDDPAAPIFATITDRDDRQRAGPLDGIRLMGQIVYSQTQASIRFATMILQDGRQGPIQAIAITVDQARTGVAEDVDNHVLERYGGLVVSGLIQGVGQVGQQLTQQNTVTTFSDGLSIQSGRGIDWTSAGMGAALPVGQALTAAAARSFSRPPTLSSPVNFPIGIVFLQPVVVPLDAGGPAYAPGTGYGVAAGLIPGPYPAAYAGAR